MTDTTTESLPAPSELEVATATIQRLQEELRAAGRRFNAVQSALQEGIDELEADDDFAEPLVDFLNGNTPWEFSLEKEFLVRLSVEVRVNARSEDDARELVDRADVSVGVNREEYDIEDVSITDVQLA